MVYQFKITVEDVSNPTVWRRIRVPSQITFEFFSYLIVEVMGWSGYEQYAFMPNGYGKKPWILDKEEDHHQHKGTLEGSEEGISDYFVKPGDHMTYMYDMIFEWTHEVILEEIDKFSIAPSAILLDGEGACPPEYCGGAMYYEELKKILADKNHPKFAEKKKWIIDQAFHTPNELLELEKEDVDPKTLWDPFKLDLEMAKMIFNSENKNVFDDIEED